MTTTSSDAAVSQPRGQPPWLRRYTLWAVGLVVLVIIGRWAVDRLSDFLIIMLTSFFAAFALEPAVNWLAARGWKRSVATLALYFAIGIAVVVFFVAVGALLVTQITDLIETLPEALADLEEWLNETFGVELSGATEFLEDRLGTLGSAVAGSLLGIGAALVGLVFQFFTVVLFAYYLVSQGPQFRRAVCSVLAPHRQREVLRVWSIAIDKTAGFLYSRALLGAISAVCTGLFLWLIGVPYALTLGLFVGLVSQFVPTIGTYIAGAVPTLVALTVSPTKALLVLAFVIVYQQIENYVLSPPLAAHTMEIHPAVAFGGVIVGTALLGPVGAFLALPMVATIQAFVSTYVQRHDLVDEELLKDTERRGKVVSPPATEPDATEP
jgi:predicted PurR-regulated permease PerM